MMSAPSVADLAVFTGRPEGGFSAFAAQALAQATLLFRLVTKRVDYPDDADLATLARNAIMQMADRLLLEQPHAVIRASPFSSETIGSYSYSRSTVFQQAKDGNDTGLVWWELALDELSLADRSLLGYGAVEVYHNDLFIETDNGQLWIFGPGDLDTTDAPGVSGVSG